MGWPYSDLSHLASQNGGPQQYIRKIRLHERQLTTNAVNKRWVSGIIPALAILIPLAVKGAYNLFEEYKQKHTITDIEAQQTEDKLIEHFEETDDDKTDFE